MTVDTLEQPDKEPVRPTGQAEVSTESLGTPVTQITLEDAFPPKPKPAVFHVSESRTFAEVGYDGSVWIDWHTVQHLSQMPPFIVKDGKVLYSLQSSSIGTAKMLKWVLDHGFKLGRASMKNELDAELASVEAEYRADPLTQEDTAMDIEPTNSQTITSQTVSTAQTVTNHTTTLLSEPAVRLDNPILARLLFGIPAFSVLEGFGIAVTIIIVASLVKPVLIAFLACASLAAGYITWKAFKRPKSVASKYI